MKHLSREIYVCVNLCTHIYVVFETNMYICIGHCLGSFVTVVWPDEKLHEQTHTHTHPHPKASMLLGK